MTDFGLPRESRLRSPADFERVYRQRIRAADDRLLVYGAPNGLKLTRAGSSVSRKHGNSVERHRLKRLLREAYRHARSDLPVSLDLILIPQAARICSADEYEASLRRLVEKVTRRIAQRGD